MYITHDQVDLQKLLHLIIILHYKRIWPQRLKSSQISYNSTRLVCHQLRVNELKSLSEKMITFIRSSLIIRKCSVQWSHYISKLSEHIKYFKRVCKSYLNKWQSQKNTYWSTKKSISMMRVWRWQLSRICVSI